MRHPNARRRGSAEVQWIIIVMALVMGLAATWAAIGYGMRDNMAQTAEEVGDPTKLVNRFGNGGGGS
jgi:hypothetical protein